MIHQLPSASHQSCRKRQKGPPCEATTRIPSIWSLGFISTWATRYNNLCTVHQSRTSSEPEDMTSYQFLYLRSKQGYQKHYMLIDALLSQRVISRPLLVSYQELSTWSWNYQSELRKTFNGWYESTIRILDLLFSFYFHKKVTPASGHDQTLYADSRLHGQHTQLMRWLCGVRGGTDGLPAGTTKRLLVRWLS